MYVCEISEKKRTDKSGIVIQSYMYAYVLVYNIFCKKKLIN